MENSDAIFGHWVLGVAKFTKLTVNEQNFVVACKCIMGITNSIYTLSIYKKKNLKKELILCVSYRVRFNKSCVVQSHESI